MSREYDAIIVGARCGGSPTAMLLARQGYRVLLVDKATFPSDTMSTHLAHPPAVAALARWGILDRLEATNPPPIPRYSFDFGPVTISGSPRPATGAANAYGPRRIILDALLVEAAVEAGAELREGFTVEEILVDDGRVTGIRGHAKGGQTVTERSRVVVGADGRHSLVAKAVEPERYNEVPALAAVYYTYWSGLPADAFDTAMADYQRARDEEALPIYEFTSDFAKIEPPPPEMQQLMGAMQGNQEAMDDFVSVMAGTLPAPEFFAPENAGRIMAQAGTPPGG